MHIIASHRHNMMLSLLNPQGFFRGAHRQLRSFQHLYDIRLRPRSSAVYNDATALNSEWCDRRHPPDNFFHGSLHTGAVIKHHYLLSI